MNGVSPSHFLGDLTAPDLAGYAQALVSSPPDTSSSTAVNLFQQSYNAQGGSPQIKVDGLYGPCTAAAVQAVLDANGGGTAAPSAFSGSCANGQYVAPAGGAPAPGQAPIMPSSSSSSSIVVAGLPVWAWWLLGGIAVASVAAIYFMSKHQGRRSGAHRHTVHHAHRRHHAHETPRRRRRRRSKR